MSPTDPERQDGERPPEGRQPDLFGAPPSSPVGPANPGDEVRAVAARLPASIRFGGSSWGYPGWTGVVWDRIAKPDVLARDGLRAYSAHPLLRMAGVDRTHYARMSADELRRYAAQVPESFRFLVKAHEEVTLARFPTHARYAARRGLDNARFLEPSFAIESSVAPFVEGLGAKGAVLLFQFAPQDPAVLAGGAPASRAAGAFAERLHRFLTSLPGGAGAPLYAVEVRNAELLVPAYADALHDAGAVHCINVLPRMPPPRVQAALARTSRGPALVVRWMLAQGLTADEAGTRYAPFDRLVDPDPGFRDTLARAAAAYTRRGKDAYVIVSNTAEGSAPLSITLLAARTAEVLEDPGG